jgi:hypothetical protein
MDLRIGAPVDCRDESCGRLTGVVVDPRSRTATHVVVDPPAGHTRARLVPVELIAQGADRVLLTCTKSRWRRLQHVEERHYAGDPSGGSLGPLLLWPYYDVLSGADLPVVVEHLPPGEVEIGPGDDVQATDGALGRLDGVVIDGDHRVTHILLREGHLWRKKEVAIPAGSIEALAPDGVHVTLTKREIADLPPWPEPRSSGVG